ncbi:pyridoxamine 5'-phosphate oxidase [Nocardioides korecus]
MDDGARDGGQQARAQLADLRREYGAAGLLEADLAPDPVTMFGRWFDQAGASGIHEPNAVVVSTVGPDGGPSSRTVLLKGLDERGFVFYTNYDSRKGHDLDARPGCALLFPWHDLERQVRVEGRAERVSDAESSAYFARRPRGSQLGAWASPQSHEVASREELDQRYADAQARFEGRDVERPPHWGGFRVVPAVVEFWQGRPGRMHDRIVYRRDDAGEWTTVRLAP